MTKKISKIQAQKRKGRYNVYLDGQYAFPVDESVLIKYRLMRGMEIDDDLAAKISNDDAVAKAYSKMLDFLSHQLRTEKEVRQKMVADNVPPQFVEPVMQKLRGQGYLDDLNYAQSYVRTIMRTELKGPRVIRQNLRQKGIGEIDIDRALTQFDHASQVDRATELAKKLYRHYQKQPLRRQTEKVRQGLMTHGFDGELFDEIEDEIAPEQDADQQAAILNRAASKAWRHYQGQKGYAQKMKFKAAMFRKGFDLDDVEHWLELHTNND
ncbi:MAG TPA: recombination regulator RecX [Candidatus Limosilactobacillus merdigallinarum]|uniref:Regulatory protein RecX n=1 Tax=Candidatus Limosilactobacillus merdigallinarum TaxID=2838652 RepID=A0A9D1VJ72_9LACO|nr:recombination regulator RecX [Candidatus Limosilactobacillus merdigallinarum]